LQPVAVKQRGRGARPLTCKTLDKGLFGCATAREVRPPGLTDTPTTGTYRTAYGHNLRGGWSVARADVAQLMLRVLDQPQTINQTIGIANY